MNQDNVIQQPDPSNITLRGTILERAKQIIEGDRNQTYGNPQVGMECFANLVAAYLDGRAEQGLPISGLTGVDGAMIAILLKVSRVTNNQQHADNFIDIAGYAGIGAECAAASFARGEGIKWAAGK